MRAFRLWTIVQDYEDEVEILEPIDGCTEDVGWMRLVADILVDAEFSISVYGYLGGGWHVFYRRPLEIVLW